MPKIIAGIESYIHTVFPVYIILWFIIRHSRRLTAVTKAVTNREVRQFSAFCALTKHFDVSWL